MKDETDSFSLGTATAEDISVFAQGLQAWLLCEASGNLQKKQDVTMMVLGSRTNLDLLLQDSLEHFL